MSTENLNVQRVENLQETIYALAYEVASYKYPKQYDYSEEQIEEIIVCAGLNKEFLDF